MSNKRPTQLMSPLSINTIRQAVTVFFFSKTQLQFFFFSKFSTNLRIERPLARNFFEKILSPSHNLLILRERANYLSIIRLKKTLKKLCTSLYLITYRVNKKMIMQKCALCVCLLISYTIRLAYLPSKILLHIPVKS